MSNFIRLTPLPPIITMIGSQDTDLPQVVNNTRINAMNSVSYNTSTRRFSQVNSSFFTRFHANRTYAGPIERISGNLKNDSWGLL